VLWQIDKQFQLIDPEEHHITVTALHSHMLTEQPRVFFMHFWAADNTESVAEGIKAALGRIEIK
jgi:hypothetical protein